MQAQENRTGYCGALEDGFGFVIGRENNFDFSCFKQKRNDLFEILNLSFVDAVLNRESHFTTRLRIRADAINYGATCGFPRTGF